MDAKRLQRKFIRHHAYVKSCSLLYFSAHYTQKKEYDWDRLGNNKVGYGHVGLDLDKILW